MESFTSFLRKLSVSLLAAVLSASLFGLAFAQVGQHTIRDKETVKSWFSDSGFYDKLPDILLQRAKKGGDSNPNLPTEDPAIKAAADKALNANFLKNGVTSIVDGSFSFLNGKTQNPDFSVDLTGIKQTLGDAVKNYVTERAASLPICTADQLTPDFDPYNATCRPSVVSADQAGEQARTQLLSQEIFSKPTLSASDIKIPTNDGKSSTTLAQASQNENAVAVKKVYQRSGSLPLILGVISLLSGLGIIFLSSTRKAGIKRVGVILIVSGVLLLLIFVVMGPVYSAVRAKVLDGKSEPEVVLGVDFLRAVFNSIRSTLLWFGIGYGVAGIACVVIASRIDREVKEKTILDEEPTPIQDSELEVDDKPKKVKTTEKEKLGENTKK